MNKEVETLELFIEAQDRPAPLNWQTMPQNKSRQRSIRQAMKTIQWKFRDPLALYPEIRTNARVKVTGPKDVFDIFYPILKGEAVEHFFCVWLSSWNKVIGFEEISRGNLNSSIVHPREVFRGAIVASAANIIIIHNHPSGNTEPSNEDISITKRLVEAGKIMDIHIFDHLIIAGTSYLSFTEERLM